MIVANLKNVFMEKEYAMLEQKQILGNIILLTHFAQNQEENKG